MNLRFKTLLIAKKTNFPEHWAAYRELRNRVTHVIIIWTYLMKLRIANCVLEVSEASYQQLIISANSGNKET